MSVSASIDLAIAESDRRVPGDQYACDEIDENSERLPSCLLGAREKQRSQRDERNDEHEGKYVSCSHLSRTIASKVC